MSFAAIGLLFGSAILHTTWNVVIKQAGEKYMATWWGMLIGSLLFIPALLFIGLPARSTWPLLTVSAFLGAMFFVLLSFAYEDRDFSLIYPISRGAAPALIAVWSVLFLGERLSAGGIVGLAVIVAGLLIVGSSGLAEGGGLHKSGFAALLKAAWPALALALIISCYSVIDGAAVKRTDPLSYAGLDYFLSAMFMTPLVFARHGWGALRREFRLYGWRLAITGALIVGSYLVALWAYRTSSVSYTGAIREMNVVLGAAAGWQFLGEKFGAWRVAGALVMFAGIVIIAVYG
jgi:drug/metabolite transporter (DMT)-like permease